MTVHELCEKVAALFYIPDSAVRLQHGGQVLVPGLACPLCFLGVAEGSELLLLEEPTPESSQTPVDTFAVTVGTVAGEHRELGGLHQGMTVHELCEKVAALFSIPDSAVRLLHEGQVLVPGLAWSLCTLGVVEGSKLVLLEEPSPTLVDTFAVTIGTIAGERRPLEGLHQGMTVHELCDKVAALYSIPDFAVRLLHEGQVHVSGSAAFLHTLGVAEGSELLLLKQWGWGKPDLHLLQELHAQWRTAKSC